MRILLASSSSGSRGGGELYLVYLGEALARRGHEVTLWASRHQRIDELAQLFEKTGRVVRAEYENTYDLPGRSIQAWMRRGVSSRVAAEWRSLAPDVVLVNKQNLEDGLDLVRAATVSRLPAVCLVHITQTARYLRAKRAWLRDWVSGSVLRAFPGLFAAVSEERRAGLGEFIGDQRRARLIPSGVPLWDLSRRDVCRAGVRAELGFAAGQRLVLAVGRMVSQKRPLLWLARAEQLARRDANARFIWIGDGALSGEWDARVAERGLAGVIHRVPWQRDVSRFLLAGDLFLHTAEFEGLPLALLEAMSAGLPCAVAADLRADLSMLTDENSIAVGDEEAWLDLPPQRLGAMGSAGRALVAAEYSFDRMAETYEALFREARGGQS